jgi:hypothetical protein
MAKAQLSGAALKRLLRQLSAGASARVVEFRSLRKARVLPEKFEFGPDLSVKAGRQYFLVHQIASPNIPERVAKAARQIKKSKSVSIVAYSPLSKTADSRACASGVVEHCIKLRIGLVLETPDGCFMVIPPRYRIPPGRKALQTEHGHIPSWIIERLRQCKGFSPYLTKCLNRFAEIYLKLTAKEGPSYSREAQALYSLVDEISEGDRRLFFPVHRLQALQAFERSRANTHSRDHFFHTFNDLFLGLLIFGELFSNRKKTARPDRFLEDPSGISKLYLWESLWTITCLFHDPGYLAESPWSTFYFTLGLEHTAEDDPSLPDSMKLVIQRVWNGEFTAARKDLVDLFRRISDHWVPDSVGADVALSFDAALEAAYFDNGRLSHSIVSGLSLIQLCRTDTASKSRHYDAVKALIAAEIAALSMIFHDQRCRSKLEECGLPPLPFEELPYASMLMFADALQDDRRKIEIATFPRMGVLISLLADPEKEIVKAVVSLPQDRRASWPYMIAEYESVTRWINRRSEMKFLIDYSSTTGTTLQTL